MDRIVTRKLSHSVELPLLGFGTYLITEEEAKTVVLEALRVGYRHIDTAEFYNNERGVGDAIRQAISEGLVTREQLFVTTKLWPGNAAWGQTPKTFETTLSSLDESLEKLGLAYVDLYLIHATFDHEQRLAQWRGMVELQKQGKARAVGVSNFNVTHLEELKAAALPKPAVKSDRAAPVVAETSADGVPRRAPHRAHRLQQPGAALHVAHRAGARQRQDRADAGRQ